VYNLCASIRTNRRVSSRSNRPVRRLVAVLAGIWLATSLSPATAATPSQQVHAKIEPLFLRQVLTSPAGATFRFLVTLQPAADLERLPANLTRAQQSALVVERLQAVAQESQATLSPILVGLQSQGHLQQVERFWVVNGLALQGNRTAILSLAERPEVISVRRDRWQQWVLPDSPPDLLQPTGLDWGIEQIHASEVWSALRITGDGVTIATVDTGVDWLHPVLQPAYRGWHSGVALHTGNWFDATDAGALYPVDSLGHGTLVTGLATGQDGIGVAPGARWIAVRAFDSSGYALDSWLHAAFQWLLAPGGNTAWAPDIINNSWSSPNGWDTEFRPDLLAIRAAGILPVFAAGNWGPREKSIGAPASYPEALAVGASDCYDEVASFSARGPGPFGGVKPEVVAPGVNLRSAIPGGALGQGTGTSFAAPLVAGVAALLRQAAPYQSWDQLTSAMTSTAVPLGEPRPNSNSGWGRVDALQAVVAVVSAGRLEGVVRGVGSGTLASASVSAVERGGGASGYAQTGTDGEWSIALAAGIYDLEVERFGYASAAVSLVEVVTGTTTHVDTYLAPLPGGMVDGQVTDSGSGDPLPATVRVAGAPVSTTASLDGWYTLSLPAGNHTLVAEHWGHRVSRAVVNISIGSTTHQDLPLRPSPELLLVDSGPWYYGSEIGAFRDALDDQGYLYDLWSIHNPLLQTPVISDLLPYDAVIWSSPFDSPGYIGAGKVISDYLAGGGNLLLSGQDIGYWDDGDSWLAHSVYYQRMLKAHWLSDDASGQELTGVAGGLLQGISLTLNNPDSAQNQLSPDSVTTDPRDHAQPLLEYAPGELGGIAAGTCLAHRSFYLSFGLEGAGSASQRAEIMGAALDWFSSPRQTVGLEVSSDSSLIIAPSGTVITHALDLFNSGEAGIGDLYVLSLSGNRWPSTLVTNTLFLSPCSTGQVMVRVEVPPGLGISNQDVVTLTIRSSVSPTLSALAKLATRTPAAVLLVDDDRWYDQRPVYQQTLAIAGISYDVWDTDNSKLVPSTLERYPVVLWFTGYDWFSPITSQEASAIESYLAEGGRLFLSSQDALYYRADSSLARNLWGVLSHREDVTPTLALGSGGRLAVQGEFPLDYPFRNFSDGLVPAPSAVAEISGDSGWPMGLSNAGKGWKSLFLAFPFEALREAHRVDVIDQAIGWLGWLGESEFQASQTHILPGATIGFTVTLRNDGPQPMTAVLTNPLPAGLQLIPGSIQGGSYEAGAVIWQGPLLTGEEHRVYYAGTASQTLTNTALLSHLEHGLAVRKPLRIWVDAPDLSNSDIRTAVSPALPGQVISYSLCIGNQGTSVAEATSVRWWLPPDTTILTTTLSASQGDVALVAPVVTWQGSLAPGDSITVSVGVQTPLWLRPTWHPSMALVNDGVNPPLVRHHFLPHRSLEFFLPLAIRS